MDSKGLYSLYSIRMDLFFSSVYWQLALGWFWFKIISNPWVRTLYQQIHQWREYWLCHFAIVKKELESFDVCLALTTQGEHTFQLLEFPACQDDCGDHSSPFFVPFYALKKASWSSCNGEGGIQTQYLGYRSGNVGKQNLNFPRLSLSPTTFIMIAYMCGDFSVFMDLSPAFFVSGSEILSKEFVKWWLEYHYSGSSFIFDYTYKINLTDFELNYFSIGFEESIVFNDTGSKYQYKILHHGI